MSTTGSELGFDHVTVTYGRGPRATLAVDDVSLVVPAGTSLGLVGESGSGKSTLARASVGLVRPSAGTVRLDETDVRQLPRRRRPIRMVFQDPYSSLNPRLTIGESIAEAIPPPEPGAPRGRAARRARDAEVARLLELVNLDAGRAAVLPAGLSGGQRQRVALARALAGRPEVIVADEITSALDVSVQGAVLNLLRRLRQELDLTILFISHDLAVVRYVCDHVAVLYRGKLVETGPTEKVLGAPEHPYTAELIAAATSSETLGVTGRAG